MNGNELPFVDKHCIDIGASPDRIWGAVADVVAGDLGRISSRWFATLVGCDDAIVEGTPLSVGSTVVGFRVVEAEPERRVRLDGRHKFSRYSLTIELDNNTLCAITNAEFPGLRGSLYKGLVIRSHGHVFGVTRILKRIKKRAERPS